MWFHEKTGLRRKYSWSKTRSSLSIDEEAMRRQYLSPLPLADNFQVPQRQPKSQPLHSKSKGLELSGGPSGCPCPRGLRDGQKRVCAVLVVWLVSEHRIFRRFNARVSQLKMHYFSEGAFESLIASQLLKKEKYI